jgi:recombinational DNA repair ATPase RecF
MLSKIKILNVKKLDYYELNTSALINIIIGDNGVGKTSLLEAINLLLNNKSFKNISKGNMISYDKNMMSVDLVFTEGNKVTNYEFEYIKDNSKTFFYLNGKKVKHSEITSNIVSLLIDSRTINDFKFNIKSRMDLLDKIASIRYKIINILKKDINKLIDIRKVLIENNVSLVEINIKILELKLSLSNIREKFVEEYNLNSENKIVFIEDIDQNKVLNDLDISFNGIDFSLRASSGEQRRAIMIFVINSIKVLYDLSNTNILLMLDDIFSELDDKNQSWLINFLIKSNVNSIITTTHYKSENKMLKIARIGK